MDFVEEDIEFVSRRQVAAQLDAARQLVEQTAAQLSARRRDALPRVTLVGWPNVGKSSLFNALTQPAAALVSDQPGTTRDYLTAEVRFAGLACHLIDTAGRETLCESSADSVDAAAQRQALAQAESADVELFCLDATRPANAWEQSQLSAAPARGAVGRPHEV